MNSYEQEWTKNEHSTHFSISPCLFDHRGQNPTYPERLAMISTLWESNVAMAVLKENQQT